MSPQTVRPLEGSELLAMHRSNDNFELTGDSLKMPQTPLAAQFMQKQQEASDLLIKLAGGPETLEKLVAEQGRKLTFEEFVDLVMMNAIGAEQKKVTELVQTVQDNGNPGLNGFVAQKAASVAGIAGAAIGGIAGGYFGGAAGAASGAAVGQDVLKRAVGSATGYPADGPNSMQMLMMKLDSAMKALDRVSNTATNMQERAHKSLMAVVSNFRG